MHQDSDSTRRKPGHYILFAIAFIGFVIAAGGVVVGSAHSAVVGTVVLLGALLGFLARGAE